MDIDELTSALSDCKKAGLPQRPEMKTALATKERIDDLLVKMRSAMERKLIWTLKDTIEACQEAGIPERYLTDAAAVKNKVEQMLAKLGVAVQLHDIEVLKTAIEECEALGLPAAELKEARETKAHMEKMLEGLRKAISAKNKEGVKDALVKCGCEYLKSAIECCRAASVPESELEDAMAARAALAASLPEKERERLLQSLKTCKDEEKQASYAEAVSMLRDAITTGQELPDKFQELLNDLIINQVM